MLNNFFSQEYAELEEMVPARIYQMESFQLIMG